MCGVHCAVCSFALWVLMCRVMATKLMLVLYQTGSKGELRLRVSTSLLCYEPMTNLESVEIASKRWGTQKNWAKKSLMKIMLHLDFSGRSTWKAVLELASNVSITLQCKSQDHSQERCLIKKVKDFQQSTFQTDAGHANRLLKHWRAQEVKWCSNC